MRRPDSLRQPSVKEPLSPAQFSLALTRACFCCVSQEEWVIRFALRDIFAWGSCCLYLPKESDDSESNALCYEEKTEEREALMPTC